MAHRNTYQHAHKHPLTSVRRGLSIHTDLHISSSLPLTYALPCTFSLFSNTTCPHHTPHLDPHSIQQASLHQGKQGECVCDNQLCLQCEYCTECTEFPPSASFPMLSIIPHYATALPPTRQLHPRLRLPRFPLQLQHHQRSNPLQRVNAAVKQAFLSPTISGIPMIVVVC